MNTQGNNKLIAEFMGYETYEHTDSVAIRLEENNGFSEVYGHVHTKYHKSWDWLMPVVEKIWDCIGNRESLFYFTNDDCNIVIVSDGLDNKKDCYNAVIEFIKWYNENK